MEQTGGPSGGDTGVDLGGTEGWEEGDLSQGRIGSVGVIRSVVWGLLSPVDLRFGFQIVFVVII